MVCVVVCVPVAVIVFLYLLIIWFFTWRNFCRILFVLACFIALTFLFYAEEDFRGWHAWIKFKQAEEAKGESFNLFNFSPPTVPDDENFTFAPIIKTAWKGSLDKNGKLLHRVNTNVVNRMSMSREGEYSVLEWPTNYGYWAKGRLTDLKEWQNYYRALAAKTNEFPVSSTSQSPAADVLLALSKYDLQIEEIRTAAARPYSRFPVTYTTDHPFDLLFVHLSSLKQSSQVLELRAVAELENYQSGNALDDVKLMLRLIDSIHSEPFLITHLVRNGTMSITMQPIWEGLVKHKWSDAQLEELEQQLAKLDFLKDYKLSMYGERAGGVAQIESMRKHRDYHEIANIFQVEPGFSDDSSQKRVNPAVVYPMPGGWYYQNKITITRQYQQWLLPMVDADHHLAFPKIENDADGFSAEMKIRPWNVFANSLSELTRGAEKLVYMQSVTDMARVVCALKRYHLAHNEYPETIDALAPQFITQNFLTTSSAASRFIIAARSDGKFLFYSVGWNETDDGGQVALKESGSINTSKR